jgi:hypothetical protein
MSAVIEKVERWVPGRHLPMLTRWGQDRDMYASAGDPECYPPTGVVALDAAAGFLFLTNATPVAYLDNFISDPRASNEVRARALELVLDGLLEDARACGVRAVLAATSAPSLVTLARSRGFTLFPQSLTYIMKGI